MEKNFKLTRKIKAKKLGVLIRDARQSTCRTKEECALALGVSLPTYEAFEMGEQAPSLPELELLAYYLKVNLDHFLGDALLQQEDHTSFTFEPQNLIHLRQKMIGVLIRKTRLEKELSLEQIAEHTGIDLERLKAYEMGQLAIPLPELDQLSLELGWQLKAFQDARGPVGEWLVQQRHFQNFMALSPDMQAFVSKPINQPYLEIAQRLSEMSVEKLRNVAEVLLEITL